MSLHTFKKKGLLTSGGVNQSGKLAPGIWLSRGPFGSGNINARYGSNGFSINGGSRSASYIGKESKMSRNGTPFYGQNPIGFGGSCGRYPQSEPLFNMSNVKADVNGGQCEFVKQSVLSNKGMLETRFRWIHNGVYPNNIVKNNFANDNLGVNGSQWQYIDKLAAANDCVNDVNNPDKYIGNIKKGGGTGCSTTNAKYKSYNIISSGGLYHKNLGIAQTSSQQTLKIQRKCANPTGNLKPWPVPISINSRGIGSSNEPRQTTGPPPEILTPFYLNAPEWYTNS